MSAGFERFVAGRYLRSRRRGGFISVIAWVSFLGIMLGVATLIIVMAVMNGFRADLLDRILGVGGHAIIYADTDEFADEEALKKRLLTIDGVERVSVFMQNTALASAHDTIRGVVVRGMKPEEMQKMQAISDNLREGSLEEIASENAIAIGAGLAQEMRLAIGDTLALIAPAGATTPFGVVPSVRSFPIAAIFQIGMSEFDKSLILLPLAEAQALFGQGSARARMEVILDEADRIDSLQPALQNALANEGQIVNWKQSNATLTSALVVERNVMFLILTLILLIAALNIVSGLVMLVKEKTRDIAVLRTMGAGKYAIMRIFFLAGATIGVVGTFFGLVLGILFCVYIEKIRAFLTWLTGAELFPAEIYYLSQLPVRMETKEVLLVIIIALGLSFLSTLYPAWKAASMTPVEGLRNE